MDLKIKPKSDGKTALISTLYGDYTLTHPVLLELINCEPFKRLKSIHQYGVVKFIQPTEEYSRFDHSLGVFLLLNKAAVSLEEQISGLLHDVSHTVFSHVGDYVFEERYPGSSYQDDIHLWYLEESGISDILKKHGFKAEDIYHKQEKFKALDQPLPKLCADRIEYNLQGGLLRGLITKQEFHAINEDLEFEAGEWSLSDQAMAKKLAMASLIMTETLWAAPWEALSYKFAAEALRESFETKEVTFDEFHFSTDEIVWNKLLNSKTPEIMELMDKVVHIHDRYELVEKGKEDFILKLKFRGINPKVRTDGAKIALTKLDEEFALEFNRVKEVIKKGWSIRLL